MNQTEERLQKIISNRGYGSRRNVEKLITAGRVKVDGVVITQLGFKTSIDARIEIDNREVINEKQKYYFLFNKPRLVLTTMYDPKGRKTVAEYFKQIPARVYPVGRLDYDVAGLLIMTNDGEFANFVSHPRYEFFKTYQALCQGAVKKEQVKKLVQGVVIDDHYKTKAIDSKILKVDQENKETIIELTIAEGHKHHVKKMLEAVEINLKKLKRTKIEFLTDEDLKVGEYRKLTPHEVKRFYGLYQSVKRKSDFKK